MTDVSPNYAGWVPVKTSLGRGRIVYWNLRITPQHRLAVSRDDNYPSIYRWAIYSYVGDDARATTGGRKIAVSPAAYGTVLRAKRAAVDAYMELVGPADVRPPIAIESNPLLLDRFVGGKPGGGL